MSVDLGRPRDVGRRGGEAIGQFAVGGGLACHRASGGTDFLHRTHDFRQGPRHAACNVLDTGNPLLARGDGGGDEPDLFIQGRYRLRDPARSLGARFSELPDLARDYREAFSRATGAGRLDRRVECQQFSLRRELAVSDTNSSTDSARW